MAALISTIYTIKNILEKFNISDDSRTNERAIAAMVNSHRAAMVLKDYYQFRRVDPVWQQEVYVNFTRVTSSDDPSILGSTLCLGKVTLPPVISLDNDTGVYRIASSSKMTPCYPISANEFFQLYGAGDKRLRRFSYYFRLVNAYYVYPYQSEGSAILVLSDPLDGYKKFTEDVLSGFLTYSDTFIVMGGQVQYGGVVYNPLQTFVATPANGDTFTGNGIVQYLNKKRKMNMFDEYPMSRSMETEIILSILTNEFKIEAVMTPDIINDARDYALRRLQERKV